MLTCPSVDVDTKEMLFAIREVEKRVTESDDVTFAGMEKVVFGDKGVLSNPRFDVIRGGCDLFKMRLTKQLEAVIHDASNTSMDNARNTLIERCRWYHTVCEAGPSTIVNDLLPFVRHTSKVLVLGSGSCLALALKSCISVVGGVKFYVLEGRPTNQGKELLHNISVTKVDDGPVPDALVQQACTIVPDSAVGCLLPEVDFVVVGAFAMTEHGGLIHCPGTLQLAIVAQSMKVPVYVLCETFKFVRIFPISVKDLRPLPPPANTTSNAREEGNDTEDQCAQWPTHILKDQVELIPPELMTLIFSEQGIITPSAVAHEMFRIYTGRESVPHI